MTAKTCLNKGTALQSSQFIKIEDDQNVIREVIMESKNKWSLIKVAIRDYVYLYLYLFFC